MSTTVMKVAGKTALVTGGANGIGFRYVVELLRNKAKSVAILDLPNSKGEAVVAKLEAEFGKGSAIFLVCDVTKADQLTTCLKKVVATFNGLDILINNAGILDDARFELMIDLNFTSLVRATLLGISLMGKHEGGKGGTIVNVASIVGLRPALVLPIYSGTKHAVIGFTRPLQILTEKTGIRFLVMCPGVTDTPLITESANKFLDIFEPEVVNSKLMSYHRQSPDNVARGMIDLIEKGENGGVYVSEDDKPLYLQTFADFQKPF